MSAVFDPFAEGFTDDPHPHYARLRAGSPVHRHPLGFWIVSGYDDALDRIADSGGGDVVAELAFPLPFTVISLMLGVPVLEQERVRELSGTLVRALEPPTGASRSGPGCTTVSAPGSPGSRPGRP